MAHVHANIPESFTDRNTTIDAHRRDRDQPRGSPLTGVEEYRGGCLKLEKARHERVYDAERRRIYGESAVLATYQRTVIALLDQLDAAKRAVLIKALADNAEKTRQVEELRYGICKDEVAGTWQRRHEMSLRGRNQQEKEEQLVEDKPKRRKDSKQKVKLHVELDEAQVVSDLAEMRGDKRTREDAADRKTKKRK